MRSFPALICILLITISGANVVAQQESFSPSTAVGEKAVGVVLKHYSLNPLALNPVTGKAIAGDGSWSIGKKIPVLCSKSKEPCVEVFYTVSTAAVQCSWVVLLHNDGTDGTFLDQNEAADYYLLRKVSQNEARPLIQFRSKPVYPPIAIAAHVRGSVVMNAVINKDGHIQHVVAVSGPEMLRGASIYAARKWIFTPTMVGTKFVPYEVQLTFNFKTSVPPIGNIELLP